MRQWARLHVPERLGNTTKKKGTQRELNPEQGGDMQTTYASANLLTERGLSYLGDPWGDLSVVTKRNTTPIGRH